MERRRLLSQEEHDGTARGAPTTTTTLDFEKIKLLSALLLKPLESL